MSANMMLRSSSIKTTALLSTHAAKPAAQATPFKSTFQGTSQVFKATKSAALSRRERRSMISTTAAATTLFDITVDGIDGKPINMSQFKGKVVLILNVASQCGFTPQYKELVQLYNKYNKQGLEILGQPCNQFGGQEPAPNPEIKKFAQRQGATFTMLAKADVNGSNATPLFKYLKDKQGGLLGSDIKWNFSKFLVDRDGNVVKRYGSVVTPTAIEEDIKKLL